jgi:hypothetical protein
VLLDRQKGLDRKGVGSLWDGISLTPLEDDVLAALHIIAPGVEGLSFVGEPEYSAGRIPIVRITGIDEPLPLRSLGDGRCLLLPIVGIALKGSKKLLKKISKMRDYSFAWKARRTILVSLCLMNAGWLSLLVNRLRYADYE